MNWYLIKTKPNAHIIASENLKRQNFMIFLPLVFKTSKKNKKFESKTSPLFPGYLFIGSTTEILSWKSINATRGVSNAVTLDGKYRPVNSNVVEELKNRCDEKGIIKSQEKFMVGDNAKIQKGPLSEFIGQIEYIESTERIWMLIQLMNQKTRIQIALSDIVKSH